ncbi:hypothetical protein [Nodosilinea sp. FACHB-13]|nr:hypothetical protein [Nodosilinea sp. FACHB-13]MBD2109549.1 hypothetical protein [Nodosilinea sp. FACHB-13]
MLIETGELDGQALRLDGEGMRLNTESLRLDGKAIAPHPTSFKPRQRGH